VGERNVVCIWLCCIDDGSESDEVKGRIMSKERQRKTQSSQKPRQTRRARWPQLAILGGVALLVAAILILKNRAADQPAVAESEPQATATLPEAVGQTQATAELEPVGGQVAATVPGLQGSALPGELPEAHLEQLLTAGQPTLAFFHSNNCVQCIKMMEVVAQVYPEFDDSVALVDVNVYDKANSRLLQRARIRAIPTQIFFNRTRQGMVVMGAMTADQFREQMQTLAGEQ
jgi:thiol-disulfide isomerase/thioredoxin